MVESLDLRSSRALIFSNISVGTGSVLSQGRPEGMWCDAGLRMLARKIFSHFWQLVGSDVHLQTNEEEEMICLDTLNDYNIICDII